MSTTDTHRDTTGVWIALCVITIVTWFLSPAFRGADMTTSVPITIAVVVLGLIKCRLIIRHFMDVRRAPRWLRLSTDGWLLALWAGVLAIYLY